jgi:hypothetical protein
MIYLHLRDGVYKVRDQSALPVPLDPDLLFLAENAKQQNIIQELYRVQMERNRSRGPFGDAGEWKEEEHKRSKGGQFQTLYHVTPTKNKRSIMKNGLQRFKTSQWVKAGSGERYGGGEVYAFEHPSDAIRWAARMDWDLHKATGTGKISMVHFTPPPESEWEEDPSDPLSHAGSKGRWFKSQAAVPAKHITKFEPVTREHMRRLVQGDAAEFKEDEHPRDEDGKFTAGHRAGSKRQQEVPSVIEKPEPSPSAPPATAESYAPSTDTHIWMSARGYEYSGYDKLSEEFLYRSGDGGVVAIPRSEENSNFPRWRYKSPTTKLWKTGESWSELNDLLHDDMAKKSGDMPPDMKKYAEPFFRRKDFALDHFEPKWDTWVYKNNNADTKVEIRAPFRKGGDVRWEHLTPQGNFNGEGWDALDDHLSEYVETPEGQAHTITGRDVQQKLKEHGFDLTAERSGNVELHNKDGDRIVVSYSSRQSADDVGPSEIRWTIRPKESVGTVAGTGWESLTEKLQHLPELHVEATQKYEANKKHYTEIGNDMIKSLGYTPGKLTVTDDEYNFTLNGIPGKAAGSADLVTGEVTLYAHQLTGYNDSTLRGILAHEIMHQKFQNVLNEYRKERDEVHADQRNPPGEGGYAPRYVIKPDDELREEFAPDYPVYAVMEPLLGFSHNNMDKLAKTDGVTPYSRDWWKAHRNNTATWEQAYHETLAEISNLEVTDPAEYKKVAKPWRDLHKAVVTLYRDRERRAWNRAEHLSERESWRKGIEPVGATESKTMSAAAPSGAAPAPTPSKVAGLPEGQLPHQLERFTERYDLSATRVPKRSFESGDRYEVLIKAPAPSHIKEVGEGRRTEQYDPSLAETFVQDPDEPLLRREVARIKPGLPDEIPLTKDPNLMYRGISSDEYEHYLKTGKIKSQQEYNIGSEQEGLTYWATDPRSAESYANGFAPPQYKPTFEHPCYVLVARRASPEDMRKVKGTGDNELGVTRAVDRDEVTEVWRGRVAAMRVGNYDVVERDGYLHMSSGSNPSAWVVWEKVATATGDRAPFKEEEVNRNMAKGHEGEFASQGGGTKTTPKEEKQRVGVSPKEPSRGKQNKLLKGAAPNSHPATISTRRRRDAKAVEGDEYRRADLDAWREYKGQMEHDVNLFSNTEQYPNFLSSDLDCGTKDAKRVLSKPEDVDMDCVNKRVTTIVDHMKKNLRFLYDNAPEEVREQGHKWYEGAHRMAQDDADKYKLPLQSAVGVYAALSPQNLWDQNVSQAKRILDAYFNQRDKAWDKDMDREGARIWLPKPAKKSKTGEVQELGEQAQENAAEKARVYNLIKGKKLSELTDITQKAMWIRTYDEAHNPQDFDALSPDGRVIGKYLNDDGTHTKNGWHATGSIVNAIKAIESGGDRDIISPAMGNKHKVRSFYNNILDPDSDNDDVTMDTHAVGAALLSPMSQDHTAVVHSLGSKPKNAAEARRLNYESPTSNARNGMNGTYPVYAEAYRQLAKELKLRPRVLQSITWEAKRRLFDSHLTESAEREVYAAWRRYHNGEASLDKTQKDIVEIAGGFHKGQEGTSADAGRSDSKDAARRRYTGDTRKLYPDQLGVRTARTVDSGGRGRVARGVASGARLVWQNARFAVFLR